MPTFVLALSSILISVAAQFLFKQGARQVSGRGAGGGPLESLVGALSNPWIVGGFVLYGVGAVVWLTVLARWDVSKAYPLVGLGFALTLVIGAAFGESLSALRVAGVLCICLGVGIVART